MSVSLFPVLWRHELTSLYRNRVLVVLFSLVLVLLLAALWAGSSQLHTQQRTLGRIRAHRLEMQDRLVRPIRRVEAAGRCPEL